MSDTQRGTLALTTPLLRWLRADPAWARLPWTLRARLFWQARWGDINAGLSQASSRQKPAVRIDDPLLIVGLWRSGTTVMHELLAAATGCATPQTWQCMRPAEFESTPRARHAATSARPMDGLPISDDSPQEDEFALLALGVDSAYRAFWMPHRLASLRATLRPSHWLDHPQWLATLESFLAGVLRTSGGRPQPLILKSPNHTFRLRAWLRRFPGARVVWMARDPVALFHSNRKMWREMFTRYGLGAMPDDATLDAFLADAIAEAAEVLSWCLSNLPGTQFCFIDQTALFDDPRVQLRTLWHRWSLPHTLDETALSAAILRMQAGRVDRYPADVSETALAALDALARVQSRARQAMKEPTP